MSSVACAAIAGFLAAILGASARAVGKGDGPKQIPVRFATFNSSLNRISAGDLIADLLTPANA